MYLCMYMTYVSMHICNICIYAYVYHIDTCVYIYNKCIYAYIYHIDTYRPLHLYVDIYKIKYITTQKKHITYMYVTCMSCSDYVYYM